MVEQVNRSIFPAGLQDACRVSMKRSIDNGRIEDRALQMQDRLILQKRSIRSSVGNFSFSLLPKVDGKCIEIFFILCYMCNPDPIERRLTGSLRLFANIFLTAVLKHLCN